MSCGRSVSLHRAGAGSVQGFLAVTTPLNSSILEYAFLRRLPAFERDGRRATGHFAGFFIDGSLLEYPA